MSNRYSYSWTLRGVALFAMTFILEACGGGIPVRLRVDQFSVDVDLGEAVDSVESSLLAQGILPEGSRGIPAVWPEYLPRVQYDVDLTSPPVPVDLTPEEGGENEDAYKAINQAGQIVNRLEINRLVLRLERADFNVPLPELEIQVADTLDADPNDRLAWFTIGRIEAGESNEVAKDLEFQFVEGGESYLNGQMGDKEREFSLRVRGRASIDTDELSEIPRGLLRVRFITEATFFIDPQGAASVGLEELENATSGDDESDAQDPSDSE
jgi:hypothetical protein